MTTAFILCVHAHPGTNIWTTSATDFTAYNDRICWNIIHPSYGTTVEFKPIAHTHPIAAGHSIKHNEVEKFAIDIQYLP